MFKEHLITQFCLRGSIGISNVIFDLIICGTNKVKQTLRSAAFSFQASVTCQDRTMPPAVKPPSQAHSAILGMLLRQASRQFVKTSRVTLKALVFLD